MLLKAVFLIGLSYSVNAINQRFDENGLKDQLLSNIISDNEEPGDLSINAALYAYSRFFNGDFCGINLKNNNSALRWVENKIETAINNTEKSVCTLLSTEVLSSVCEAKTHCVDKSRAYELDCYFAAYYGYEQDLQNKTEPFVCKNEIISGQIINPKAYTKEFNFSTDRILIKELPCKSEPKTDEKMPLSNLIEILFRNVAIPTHFLENKDPNNIIKYYVEYFHETGTGAVCGINFNTEKDPAVKALIQKIFHFATETKLSFCENSNEIVSTFCELKTHCTQKEKENEVDLIFAFIYAGFQITQKHNDPYICKNKEDKVTLGEVINPEAYTKNFDVFKTPILIKPLPCPSKETMFLSNIIGRNNLATPRQFDPTPNPHNIFTNIRNYLEETKNNGTICGINILRPSDLKIEKLIHELFNVQQNYTGCFCSRTFVDLLPGLCQLRTYCTVNPVEIDFFFGIYYSYNQIKREHPTTFSCKKDGKEILGEIIQPGAYLPKYDLKKNPLLTKPLPCNITIKKFEC